MKIGEKKLRERKKFKNMEKTWVFVGGGEGSWEENICFTLQRDKLLITEKGRV